MKKPLLVWIIAVVVMLAIAAGAYFFVAPKTDVVASPYCGTWVISSAEMEGVALEAAELGLEASITFAEDGKAVMEFDGETENSTWKEVDGNIVVDDMTFVPTDDGGLSIDDEGVMMLFTKQ